jgi:hypothetical protein
MKTERYQIGQMIYFVLDGRWEGEGTFVAWHNHTIEYGFHGGNLRVKLTKPCKEIATGTEILVNEKEVF